MLRSDPHPLRVLVLAPYPLARAPSQRFRWEQYIAPLRSREIELVPSTFLDERSIEVVHARGAWSAKAQGTLAGSLRRLRDSITARRYDLVLVHRESSPLGPAWVERILRRSGVPYAFDFDDAIYLRASSEANRRVSWLKNPRKTAAVVRHASSVIAGNPHLGDWARTHNQNVVVIPTTIDTAAYQPRTPRPGPICVGWSGSASTIQHLELLAPVLAELQRERGIRLRVIGDPGYKIPGADVEALPWRAVTEIADLGAIDIGVMPLPDDEWARGKCGLKALQYMALGIPTVLSPVGVNREISRDNAAASASSPAEWAAVLRDLIDDDALRAGIGRAGRARVEQEYSVEAGLPMWEHALRAAAGKSPG